MSRLISKLLGSMATLGVSALGALSLFSACSKYLGDGPDPARGGRVDAGPVGFGGSSGCNPLQAIVQSSSASNCPALLSCAEGSCDSWLRSCFGQNYRSGDLSGGRCEVLAGCIESCGCGSDCLNRCNPQGDCATCLNSAKQCEDSNCQSERLGCSGTGTGGGNGNGGNGGSGGGAIELVPSVTVNALALDADTVYFTSGQGLAKVAKAGGNAVPLGGFAQLNGLAVNAQSIYAVNNDGSLLAMHKDGTGQQTLATVMCGGGSGAVVLGTNNVYFTTGPYLRVSPFIVAPPLDLAGDVWQAGGPATGARLALDTDNVYYIGNSSMGGQGALYGVSRGSAGSASCTGPNTQGTRIATASGAISALVGDGKQLYFTDLTSNGLSPVLVVSAVTAPSLALSPVTNLAMFTAGTNTSPNAGYALATDGIYLYFGGFSGIYRVLVGGPSCAPGALPCAQPELMVPSAMPSALAVDDTFLYFGDQNGPSALKKIAK